MPRGRHPKPSVLRQNRTKKSGAAVIEFNVSEDDPIPAIPNPDKREWHQLTLNAWEHAWKSPMASQWLQTDIDALGRLALLWDAFYLKPSVSVLAEIRLQESRFGLSPLDRSRLQWEISRGEEAERRKNRRPREATTNDPRKLLAVAG
jgi:hypothetical protein